MVLLIGVLALVFAPGPTRAGQQHVGSRTLSAAMLSPTTGDDGAIRAPARDDDSLFTTALALLVIAIVITAPRAWRRATTSVLAGRVPSFERARPRRGPPLLTV